MTYMAAHAAFDSEYKRLKHVLDALFDPYGITESDVSRAAGFSRTEIGTMLKRLGDGQNVALDRWRALYDLLLPSESWWFRGVGTPDWKPDSCVERIRRLSNAEKERLEAERIAKSEREDDIPKSASNVRHLRRTDRRLKK